MRGEGRWGAGLWGLREGTGSGACCSLGSVPCTPAQGLPGPSGEKGETGDVGPMVSMTPTGSSPTSGHPPPIQLTLAPCSLACCPCSSSFPGISVLPNPPHSCALPFSPPPPPLSFAPLLALVHLFLCRDHLAPQDLEALLDQMELM